MPARPRYLWREVGVTQGPPSLAPPWRPPRGPREDPLEDALAAAEVEEDSQAAGAQLDAFHRIFNFCMECRQYTCVDCWNAEESRCVSCAPVPGRFDPLVSLTQDSPLPSLAAGLGFRPIGDGNAQDAR